jgi:hypothetical protein
MLARTIPVPFGIDATMRMARYAIQNAATRAIAGHRRGGESIGEKCTWRGEGIGRAVDGGRIHRSSSARAEFQTIAPEALQPFVARMDTRLGTGSVRSCMGVTMRSRYEPHTWRLQIRRLKAVNSCVTYPSRLFQDNP